MYITYVILCTWIFVSMGTGQHSSEDSVRRCCQNTGTCIWGLACVCDRGYYGRYCEYEANFRSCSYVPHSYWVISDCALCRCFHGRFVCIPKYYFGCDDDDEPLAADHTVRPLEGRSIVLYHPDSFNRPHANASGQSRSVQHGSACLLPALILLLRV